MFFCREIGPASCTLPATFSNTSEESLLAVLALLAKALLWLLGGPSQFSSPQAPPPSTHDSQTTTMEGESCCPLARLDEAQFCGGGEDTSVHGRSAGVPPQKREPLERNPTHARADVKWRADAGVKTGGPLDHKRDMSVRLRVNWTCVILYFCVRSGVSRAVGQYCIAFQQDNDCAFCHPSHTRMRNRLRKEERREENEFSDPAAERVANIPSSSSSSSARASSRSCCTYYARERMSAKTQKMSRREKFTIGRTRSRERATEGGYTSFLDLKNRFRCHIV